MKNGVHLYKPCLDDLQEVIHYLDFLDDKGDKGLEIVYPQHKVNWELQWKPLALDVRCVQNIDSPPLKTYGE